MRALAGPAMMLVMAGGFVIYRLAASEDAPPRDFLELEFAGADWEHTGSCYSLNTVLFANRTGRDAVRTWTSTGKDSWTFVLDDVVQASGRPIRLFQKFTFEKHGDLVRLVSVETSKELDDDLNRNIEQLVTLPGQRHSTPVDRCLEPGAKGYLFNSKR